MKKVNYYIVITGLIISILISCTEPSQPVGDAVKFGKDEILNNANYLWLKAYWNTYKPDSSYIVGIDSSFKPSEHKFVIFVKPECSCNNPDRSPGDLLKCFDFYKIGEANIEIYSMGSYKTNHPYKNVINLKELPAAYLLKSGSPVYSVIDTFHYYTGIKGTPIELYLQEALRNN